MTRRTLYARALGLRHLRPSTWQRAVFVEGAFLLAALLVLADLASAWVLLAAPAAVAVAVKFHDLLIGALPPRPPERDHQDPPGPGGRGGG